MQVAIDDRLLAPFQFFHIRYTSKTKPRPFALLCLVALAATANANAAMGLALEMFEFRIWIVYVVVTIVFEAWFIGRALSLGWVKSGLVSLGANFVSSFCCAGGAFAPLLHGSIGRRQVPSPFWAAVFWLTVFGLVSAFIEAVFWQLATKRAKEPLGWFELKWTPLSASFAAHMIGVPLALVILLVPAHPYQGLMGLAQAGRRFDLLGRLIQPLKQKLESGSVPSYRSFSEAAASVGFDPNSIDLRSAYFDRFGGSAPLKVEWNSALDGKNLEDISQPVWLIRLSNPETGAVTEYEIGGGELLTYKVVKAGVL